MIKVLIVDDESPIREWIKYCIDRSFESGFSVDLASNGLDALEKFKTNHHDIVITDIRMPVMDGLALIENVYSMNPDTCIMILTSHSDFEYARTAVKYQIFDYILKTEITEEYLIDILNKYLDTIKTDSSLSQSYINREAVMHKLIDLQFNEEELTIDFLKKYKIPLLNSAIFSFAIKYNAKDRLHLDGLNIISHHKGKIENVFGFCYEKNTFIFCGNIVSANSELVKKQLLNDFILEFYNSNIKCSIGVSSIFYGIKNLSQCVHVAINNLNLSFYRKNTIINNISLNNMQEIQNELDRLKKEVINNIDSNNEDTLKTKLNDFFAYIKNKEPHDIDMVKSSCLQLVEEAIKSILLLNRQKSSNDLLGFKIQINNAVDFHEIENLVVDLYADALINNRWRNKNYSHTILKAINYIEENYATITGLNEVASFVYLNSEYFSRLFKDETGVNFNTYLNNSRLSKSLDLLINTDLKVYEIAELVGYSSLSYYSKIFKKKFGINPFNYRNNVENTNNASVSI